MWRPQKVLDALRQAMHNTRIMCAVMLDTKVRNLLQAACSMGLLLAQALWDALR